MLAMAPKRQVDGGKVRAFYIAARQWRALLAFQQNHGHPNRSAALRALLDMVADSEGVDVG